MNETIGDRVRKARDDMNVTQAKLGSAAKVSGAAIHAIEKGSTKSPTPDTLFKIARYLRVNPEWLLTGIGPQVREPIRAYEIKGVDGMDGTESGTVAVGVLEYHLSAGNGWVEPEFVETKHRLPWQIDWLTKRGLKPETVRFFPVSGDSMYPTLADGDNVLIDLADRHTVMDNRVYAIWIAGEAKIKRLKKRYDNALIVMSDNVSWDDEVIPAEGLEFVHLIGRARHKGGEGGL